MRFGKVRSASFIGENKALGIVVSYRLGRKIIRSAAPKEASARTRLYGSNFWITRQETESPVQPMSNGTMDPMGLIRPARDWEPIGPRRDRQVCLAAQDRIGA